MMVFRKQLFKLTVIVDAEVSEVEGFTVGPEPSISIVDNGRDVDLDSMISIAEVRIGYLIASDSLTPYILFALLGWTHLATVESGGLTELTGLIPYSPVKGVSFEPNSPQPRSLKKHSPKSSSFILSTWQHRA